MSDENKHVFVSAKADVGDATLVRPSNWNAQHRIGILLTNRSGSSLSAGAVVVADPAFDDSFTTTTTVAHRRQVFVVQETIANNASGLVKAVGHVTLNVQGAVVRGDYLRTSATAGSAETAGTGPNVDGVFAVAATGFAGPGNGTVMALLYGTTIGEPFNGTGGTNIGYIVTALSGVLSADRRLQVSGGRLTLTDGGANADITVGLTDAAINAGMIAAGGDAVRVVDRVSTNTTVGNTTTETSVYLRQIDANSLATAKRLRLLLQGRVTASATAGQTHTATVRLKYGATTVATLTLTVMVNDNTNSITLTNEPSFLEAILSADGATNSQIGHIRIGEAVITDVTFNMTTPQRIPLNAGAGRGTSAEDSTTNLNLEVTWQWAQAPGAAQAYVMEHAVLELL